MRRASSRQCHPSEMVAKYGAHRAVWSLRPDLDVAGKEHLSEKTENEELTLEMMNAGPDDRLGCVARIVGDVAVEVPE